MSPQHAPVRGATGLNRRLGAAGATAVIIGTLALAGCTVGEGGMVEALAPPAPAADSALAALSKGQLGDAEAWATRALKFNPRDPYALLIKGMLAERAAQPAVARDAYELILALDPDARVDLTPLDMDSTPRPVVEIAAARLDRLPPAPVGAGFARVPGVTGPTAMETPAPTPGNFPNDRDDAWDSISQRFAVLERLYNEGLITNVEYRDRRRANLGAILPLTEPPPSAGLARPAPRVTAVVSRLQDLGATFERGALSASQHADERRAILDALLPAEPLVREEADMRPDTAVEAARLARRLEDALRRGLVTSGEYDAERAALREAATALPEGQADTAAAAVPPPAARVETAARPRPAAPLGAMPASMADAREPGSETATDAAAPATTRDGGPVAPRPLLPIEPGVTAGPPTANADDPVTQRFTGVTGAASDTAAQARAGTASAYVHLASYRDSDTARAGWTALSTRYAGLMRGMTPVYEPVTIPGKGDFIRLKAGPVAIPGGAPRLCDQLRAAGQFCEPTEVAR
ncbi:hypothetical protein [Roseospira goensis]|uniref:Tetratricopeptide (TPR) repeat protein n=1 Tax=Roseospira goensis TaxID=391922 RepID=A0A7W6RXF4_9PROT|nr:hypothetical protein [Roseospira goensis]MBB4285004.1 tetratricopeptide (TPR) repeat protein [Roseospira goensis]